MAGAQLGERRRERELAPGGDVSRRASSEQRESARKEGEGSDEGHRETDAHHPAEIDDGLDAAEYERAEPDDGGECGVETGPGHVAHGQRHQLEVIQLRTVTPELPVAHREMDVHREGDDQHQGEEVRRDHRDLPPHHAEQADHEEAGKGAAGERQQHPARPSEDESEHRDQEHEHTAPEHQEVVAHEVDHVAGDHRHPPEVQRAVLAVGREHGADRRHACAPSLGRAPVSVLVVRPDLFELLIARVVELAPFARGDERLAACAEGLELGIVLHREQQRGGTRVSAQDRLAENGTSGELLPRPVPVHSRRLESGDVLRELGDRHIGALEQGYVENGGDAVDVLDPGEPVAQGRERPQRGVGEELRLGGEGHHQQILGAVALLHLPESPKVRIAFEQERVRGRVEPEVAGVHAHRDENHDQQSQYASGAAEHIASIGRREHWGHGKEGWCGRPHQGPAGILPVAPWRDKSTPPRRAFA